MSGLNKIRYLYILIFCCLCISAESQSPMITFRIDDGNINTYTGWKPVFDAQGEVACSAVPADYPGVDCSTMSWAQIKELEDDGWEILCHGKTNTDFESLTDAQIDAEMWGSMAIYNAQGLTVKNITPPYYGARSLSARKIARKYFRSCGGGTSIAVVETVAPQSVDLYNLPAVRADLSGDYQADDPAGIVLVKAMIDEAIADNGWVTWYFHSYTTDKAAGVNEIIDYCQANGVEIVTINQALDVFEPYLFVGNAFGVNENSVMINRAEGEALFINNTLTKVGTNAGKGNENAHNTSIGLQAGAGTTGEKMTAIGDYTGYGGSGESCVFVGYRAGLGNTQSAIVFIGSQAGESNTGARSVGMGTSALRSNSGYGSVGVGYAAGNGNIGTRGIFIGNEAGRNNTGSNAVGIGQGACEGNSDAGRFEVKQSNANANPLLIGNFISQSFIQGASADSVAFDLMPPNSLCFWIDGDTLKVKVKQSDGALKNANIITLK